MKETKHYFTKGELALWFGSVAFLANDIYGFISWRKMEKRQRGEK